MSHTLIGVFDDYSQAQAALDDLYKNGFAIERVRLSPEENTVDARRHALRADDESAGHASGIRGFFRSLFGSPAQDRHSDLYLEAMRRGSYLLSVRAENDEQVALANEVLERHHPVDIDERAVLWQNAGWSGYRHDAEPYSDEEILGERASYGVSPASGTLTGAAAASATPAGTVSASAATSSERVSDERAIPVIQEELQVGKREVQRGGVRIFQHVSATPVQETVHLREEHVSVERHPVNEPASPADLDAIQEGSFEMRERAEEAVVAKTARVVEEVVVGKTVTEHDETISDTLRQTNVEVERIAPVAAAEEAQYRSHWTSQYGSSADTRYEDYAPAYQYGAHAAGEERYRQHRFSDIEPELEREWSVSHAGQPWERFKDAVRYGWERVTR